MNWNDVLACFADRANPESVIRRLTNEWADRYNLPHPSLGVNTPVTADKWTHKRVGEHLDRLAVIEPRLITDERPRRIEGPLVLVNLWGHIGQIDGRRRANVWRHQPWMYDVLIIHAGRSRDDLYRQALAIGRNAAEATGLGPECES